MKKLMFIGLIGLIISSCNNTESKDKELSASDIEIKEGKDNPEPRFEWKEQNWDFGTIYDGDRVEHTFRFTNTGDDDLVITDASATCGCTIPDWPKHPIAPGEKGEIKVEFNSAGKTGGQTKEITIIANTNPTKTVLQIKAHVEKKKE
jgi:hypothetical protein